MNEYYREIVNCVLSRMNEPRGRIQVEVGPRQVGKTFSIEQATRQYGGEFTYRLADGLGIDSRSWLESEWNAARLLAKASGEHLLVLDEIQKVWGWSDIVKRLWDEDTFNHVPLKIVLLGSSRLLLQKGLDESLEGRFELLHADHWSYLEMRDAFGFSIDDYILYGGYPGAAALKGDEARFRAYIRDSIIEPSISRDILQLETIAKPELLRRVFMLGCAYSARILSYQKMLGQLQETGNVTTIAHYLRLLGEAGLVCGLEKIYEEESRKKASSPKLAVCNNALMSAVSTYSFAELKSDSARWGHMVESAVGAHLLATARSDGVEVLYWNVGAKEVDYVLRKGEKLAAIEVKSGDAASISGMREFCCKYPRAKPYFVGGQGMPLEQFFTAKAVDFL